MISISPINYDSKGGIVGRDESSDSTLWGRERRISRGQNLDGTVTIQDFGHSHGDRTVTAAISKPAESIVLRAAEIVESYALVIVAMTDGVYRAAPVRSRYANGVLYIDLMIKERA